MGLTGDIRAALEAHLATVPGIPSSTTRWARQNVGFEAEPKENWLRVVLAPGFRDRLTAPAEGALVQSSGLLLVDLFLPIGAGPDAADTLGDAVVTRFPPGQQFTVVGGRSLRITRSIARTGVRETDWYHVPVEVGWEIETINALV
jgi:hypothetical protein